MRGADGGPWDSICGLPALWVGLVYDETALDAAWDLVKDWSESEREQMRVAVPRQGLQTPFRGRPLIEVAREVIAICETGLKNRARLDSRERDESHFIEPLQERVAGGPVPAEGLLEAYENDWGGDIDKLYEDIAY